MRKPEDVLPTTDAERRRLRLRKRFRRYRKQERPRRTPEELIQYLREHRIRSCGVLERTRQPTDPTVNDFKRAFGGWTEAVRQALGSELAVDFDEEYVLKSVSELNLWSVARFREARKIDPVSVPSWRQIIKHWGSYRNLIEWARRKNLKKLLEEYHKLIRRLGRVPTLEEARVANLRMDEAIKFYGGKKQMDEFVLGMEGQHERQARGS